MKKVIVLITAIIASACITRDEILLTTDDYETFLKGNDFSYVANYVLPESDAAYLQQLGFGGTDARVIETTERKTGKKYISYILDGDVEVRAEELPLMVKASANGKSQQYRTVNLVTPRTYRISTTNLSPNISQGLLDAVANYNNLGLGIRFSVKIYTGSTFGEFKLYQQTWAQGSSIHIVQVPGSGGGQARFPTSSGNPGNEIRIQSGTLTFGVNVCEHVMTHELGHCVGLRHTDFFDRSISCGGAAENEGDAGVGAIHIPGTPATTGIDFDSIMLSCFNGFEDGEFSAADIVALNALY